VVEAALDRGLNTGRCTVCSVRTYVESRRLGRQRGVGVLVRLLDDREFGVPESELERVFERLVKRERLPMPVRQQEHRRYRVDYAYATQNIVIEVDGSATRSTKTQLQRDRRRQNDIVLDGLVVLRFTWDDVSKDVPYVVATIRRALDGAGGGS
jgi:very-short-patch-repair endonuclease